MATPVAKDERSCSDADAAATSAAVHDEDPAERAVSEHDEAQTPRKRKLNEVAGGDAGTGGTAAGGEDIEAPVDRGSAAGANAAKYKKVGWAISSACAEFIADILLCPWESVSILNSNLLSSAA